MVVAANAAAARVLGVESAALRGQALAGLDAKMLARCRVYQPPEAAAETSALRARVAALEAEAETLRELSLWDALTGLLNRRGAENARWRANAVALRATDIRSA